VQPEIWHTRGMNTHEKDGAAVRLPPPITYLVAVIVGVLLHAFALSLPLELTLGPRMGAAVAVAGLGIAMMAGAMGLFKRSGQDPKPWKSTPEIISTGVYRFTRNPMYVGLALLQIGIGIGLANGWILVLVPPVLVIIYATAIRHEEAYLEHKFGDTYSAYKTAVRRWI
jgi:protein-S-isoprenylcysteine O-methyltransferase Ste14